MPRPGRSRLRDRYRLRRRALQGGGGGGEGPINLVPLVDILTSIVFFSLLTYSGSALAALTSFDLALGPTVVSADQVKALKEPELVDLLLTVRVNEDHLLLEHSADGGVRERIEGPFALDTLEARLGALRRRFPQNRDLLVLPADGISYDQVVQLLTRARKARYSGVSLGTRARKPVGAP